jgi:hypothetical protein
MQKKMSLKEFNNIEQEGLKLLDKKENEVSETECVNIVKIVNTIELNYLEDDLSISFKHKFYSYFFKLSIKKLNAMEYKGGYYYSKSYDIFIGGPPHENSMYRIDDDISR